MVGTLCMRIHVGLVVEDAAGDVVDAVGDVVGNGEAVDDVVGDDEAVDDVVGDGEAVVDDVVAVEGYQGSAY